MESSFNHIQINVSSCEKSRDFYKELLGFLGYNIVMDDKNILMMADKHGFIIGLAETEDRFKQNYFHRKNTGVNHIAFKVNSKEDVDRFYNEFLRERNIGTLYGTPKEFPEYTKGYYAVFFEDPDRIKLEVLYMP